MRKREGPSLTLRKRKTWTSPMTPLKARQHQGPVQMSGCWDTSQKEAVSQWKPRGRRRHRQVQAQLVIHMRGIKAIQRSGKVHQEDMLRILNNMMLI